MAKTSSKGMFREPMPGVQRSAECEAAGLSVMQPNGTPQNWSRHGVLAEGIRLGQDVVPKRKRGHVLREPMSGFQHAADCEAIGENCSQCDAAMPGLHAGHQPSSVSASGTALRSKSQGAPSAFQKTSCSGGPQNEVRKSAQKPVALRGASPVHCGRSPLFALSPKFFLLQVPRSRFL